MSFRTRMALLVAAAVAVVVVAASTLVYFIVRGQLRGEIDSALQSRVQELPPVSPVQLTSGEYFLVIKGPQFGAAAGFVQVATTDGRVFLPPSAKVRLPVTKTVQRVAAGRPSEAFADARVRGVHLRVLTVATNEPGYAIMLARPLTETDAALSRIKRYLIGIAAAGIGLAILLALLVTRTVLQPVRRLTEATEHVALTRDLSGRMHESGRDELARLAASFNTMLEALDESLRAQRQLVADASHELRTPLTSLRTNIEVLARADSLPAVEREKLLADVVEQLTEMSTLVSELVQLARGDTPAGETETVRLDEIVAGSVERARRNSPRVVFETRLHESTVEGVPAALERAIGNLLDNAAKWSLPGGKVEVGVLDHEVAVRDHGPGIDEADLPFVFDRFYRAPSARGMPGSGLGLAIVDQVAQSHGGEVIVERPPDGGTLVRLKLAAEG